MLVCGGVAGSHVRTYPPPSDHDDQTVAPGEFQVLLSPRERSSRRHLVMALDESATVTIAESVTAGTVIEENTLLLDASARRDDNGDDTTTTGDRVRQRLAVCLFLHIVGVAIVTQVYPRVRGCACRACHH